MSLELRDLRERTLANNLVWLRSFGCDVRREGEVVRVDNPEARDYCALLLFAGARESFDALRRCVGGEGAGSFPPNVYVDRQADGPDLRRLLTRKGCAKTSVSYVTAGEWGRAEAAADVSIRAAERSEVAQWASAYSLGFGRGAGEGALDRQRWRLAFRHEAVRHWFFTRRDEVVGVCQTCDAHGVVGVYSFTLIHRERGLNPIHSAIRTLRAKLAERGRVTVYFERVKGGGRRPFLVGSRRLLTGFKVIRVAEGYQCDGAAKAADL
ncbi:MAG: hypothetical protein LC795_17180 [Acidobacteria bacterium]|nr:hypothetical protein [Acidobacteriota bacterium]